MRSILWITSLLLSLGILAAASVVPVGQFSRGDLRGWEEQRFSGQTDYRLERIDGRLALRAHSSAAASGRIKPVQVDLTATPVLHWSWKVDRPLLELDERSRSGDDYVARVYVVFSGGFWLRRSRAISYVWSSNQPRGSTWPNAFSGRVKMLAVESGADKVGRWVREQRNVAADYRRLFGAEPGPVVAVALMTDTDNSGQRTSAWYGDIWFATE